MTGTITPEQEDMGVYRSFRLLNLDEMFAANPEAKIINNDTLVSKKLSKEFTDAIYSSIDGDLGFVPTCQCGAVKGILKENLFCIQCNTKCSSQFVDALSHTTWISMPEGQAPVLHPTWYRILADWTSIGRGNQNIIDLILNPEEDLPEDLLPFIHGRGFQYFYDNADAIMNTLLNEYPNTAKKAKAKSMHEFYETYRSCMFTTKLPVLHSSLHPMKNNGGSLNYVDTSSKEILSAIINISAESFKQHATSVSFKQANKTMCEIYGNINEYYSSLIKNKLAGKYGLLRKHNLGSRLNYTFRSVIVPHTEPMPIDELILPWAIMVNCHKLIIINFLQRYYKKSVQDALAIFMKSLTVYDPMVDDCLQRYVKAKGGKLYVLFGRNPTLDHGSLLQFSVSKWSKDPKEEITRISAGVAELPNLDFDGDEMNGLFLFEQSLIDATNVLNPREFIFSTTMPGLSTKIGMLKQNFVMLENYLGEDPDIDFYKEVG